MVGKAISEHQLLDCYFVKALYKLILGQTLTLNDLEDFDNIIFKNLTELLKLDDISCMCMNYTVDENLLGEHVQVELIPNGAQVDVTNENREDYVQKYAQYRLYGQIKD